MSGADYPLVMFEGRPWQAASPGIPKFGGTVDFNGNGVGGCCVCGWRGAPVIFNGKRSTFCPTCEPNGQPRQHRPEPRQRAGQGKAKAKRKAARAARKRGR